MKKIITVLVTMCILCAAVFPISGYADEVDAEAQPAVEGAEAPEASEASDDAAASAAESKDNLVTSKHTAVIRGKEIAYSVTTGTMAVDTGGKTCEFFFRAYTMDDVDDIGDRPITFAFNGGPGSCSYYLELGCLGPRKAEISEDGYSVSLPAKLVDNENSLLDLTDLVFIDAIGTGYSKPAAESELEAFIGYDNDIRSFGDFIRLYVNRYNRWGSEKYIAGESYGTTRAVGICEYLSDNYAIKVNGLMLLSTANDFSILQESVNNELPYAAYLPTFAADAWYHGKTDQKYGEMPLEEYLDEVREFVSTEYIAGLFKGDRMTETYRNALAQKISSYIGLSKDYILENNCRISLADFYCELLKDKNLIIGRFDGRYTGPLTEAAIENGSDPSSVESDLLFGNTFLTYLTEELNYQTDDPYIPLNDDINGAWTSPAPLVPWIGGYFSQEDVINRCMSENPYLKIWVNCGYYDAATPFYGAEWVYSHIFLDEESKGKLSFTYYKAGHMFYLEKEASDKFRKEAESWYSAS